VPTGATCSSVSRLYARWSTSPPGHKWASMWG
jgi:hypothetical protein